MPSALKICKHFLKSETKLLYLNIYLSQIYIYVQSVALYFMEHCLLWMDVSTV